MPRIYEYDPRSLVVDPSQAVGEILGAFQKKRDAEQVNELQAQLAKTPLDDPEFQKVLMRMRQVDPEAAAAAAEMALFQDQRQTAARDKELKQWSGINMAIASAPDKASRDDIIRRQISDWQQAGRDVSDLEDMLGLDADRQLLRAKTNLHMIGESELLNQIAGTSMLDQLKIQGELLGMQKTQQEIRLAEQRAAQERQKFEDQQAASAREAEEAAALQERQNESIREQAKMMQERLDEAAALLPEKGGGGLIAWAKSKAFKKSDAARLARKLKSIGDTIGFDELIRLKREGASLGGLSEGEMLALQAKFGVLDVGAPPEELAEILTDVNEFYNKLSIGAGGAGLKPMTELGRRYEVPGYEVTVVEE